jgi:hypothetical protein
MAGYFATGLVAEYFATVFCPLAEYAGRRKHRRGKHFCGSTGVFCHAVEG